MSPVAALLVRRYIAKNEYIQARVAFDSCVDACDGEEDDPGEQPDGEPHAHEHADEADEEVCVHAVDALDLGVVCIIKRKRPLEPIMGERVLSRPARMLDHRCRTAGTVRTFQQGCRFVVRR